MQVSTSVGNNTLTTSTETMKIAKKSEKDAMESSTVSTADTVTLSESGLAEASAELQGGDGNGGRPE